MVLNKIKNNRGMTLIEILIVMGILGGLLAVIGVNVKSGMDKSKLKQTKIILSNVAQALNGYYADCNKMPQSLTGLAEATDDCSNWGPEPYLKKNRLKDAWGNDLAYESSGSSFTLKSLGKDGKEGGSKLDKDIPFEEEDEK
jgi:general secretion pathway protein G